MNLIFSASSGGVQPAWKVKRKGSYRRKLCRNCGKPRDQHVKEKCLFENTYYQARGKGGGRP